MSSSPKVCLKAIVFLSIFTIISGATITKSAKSATAKAPATATAKPAKDQITQESRVIPQNIHMQAPAPVSGQSGQSTSASSQQPQYKIYPLHSDVQSEASAPAHTKTKVSHGYHNEVAAGLVEVFGLALVPILLLPLVGLGILYLLWSQRSKHNHEPYAFDNGATYGAGTHSNVVGYDYSHLNKRKGLDRANSELTARILPHL